MPSADETTTYLFKVMPETTQDALTRDVGLLVSQIKENLRLSGLKAKSSVSHRNRPSPYLVRSRASTRRNEDGLVNSNNNNKTTEDEDDAYQKLLELLKQGRLIKEAVKKLQTMNLEDLSNSEANDEEHKEDDDNDSHHRGYRRKTYYYDSEDEPLPAVYQPLDL